MWTQPSGEVKGLSSAHINKKRLSTVDIIGQKSKFSGKGPVINYREGELKDEKIAGSETSCATRL